MTASAFLNTDVAASFAAMTWLVIEWSYAKTAEVRRAADRRGRGPRHDHAGRRLRLARLGGDHRHRGGRRLLLRGRAEEPAGLGRCARRLGRARRRRLARRHPARRVRLHRVELRRARTGCCAAAARSSPSNARPRVLCAAWAFVFTYGMLWLIDHVTPAASTPRRRKRGLDEELHGEEAYPQGL